MTTWYRRKVWEYKGNKEYTRGGFETASVKFNDKDLEVDCTDRHYIITGGGSGIGLATATEIARRGGILHILSRNAKAMKEARSHIITTTGNDRIHQHLVDLANTNEVVKWAIGFLETNEVLDVIIHNAGTMVHQREVNADDVETNFSVNILAVHLITIILLPLLKRSNDPRVIFVSSGGMYKVKLDSSDLNFEKMNPFVGRVAYSQTKRQQVVLAFLYAQKFEGIKFFSMHPGWVDTPGLQKYLPQFREQMKDVLRTPEQGADTVIWLAVSQAALKYASGLFFQDRVPVPTHLPLAWTRTSTSEEQRFMEELDKISSRYFIFDSSHFSKVSAENTKLDNQQKENIDPVGHIAVDAEANQLIREVEVDKYESDKVTEAVSLNNEKIIDKENASKEGPEPNLNIGNETLTSKYDTKNESEVQEDLRTKTDPLDTPTVVSIIFPNSLQNQETLSKSLEPTSPCETDITESSTLSKSLGVDSTLLSYKNEQSFEESSIETMEKSKISSEVKNSESNGTREAETLNSSENKTSSLASETNEGLNSGTTDESKVQTSVTNSETVNIPETKTREDKNESSLSEATEETNSRTEAIKVQSADEHKNSLASETTEGRNSETVEELKVQSEVTNSEIFSISKTEIPNRSQDEKISLVPEVTEQTNSTTLATDSVQEKTSIPSIVEN